MATILLLEQLLRNLEFIEMNERNPSSGIYYFSGCTQPKPKAQPGLWAFSFHEQTERISLNDESYRFAALAVVEPHFSIPYRSSATDYRQCWSYWTETDLPAPQPRSVDHYQIPSITQPVSPSCTKPQSPLTCQMSGDFSHSYCCDITKRELYD